MGLSFGIKFMTRPFFEYVRRTPLIFAAYSVLLPKGILQVMQSTLTRSSGNNIINRMNTEVKITKPPVIKPIIGFSRNALKASKSPAAQYASAAEPMEARVTVPNRYVCLWAGANRICVEFCSFVPPKDPHNGSARQ